MRIWIVKYGESVPFLPDSVGSHLFRSGELARRLVERGHEVVWWTGQFEHPTKLYHRIPGNEVPIPGSENSKVVLLYSPGYSSNISLMRFYDHWRIGRSFREAAVKEPVPDIIVASMPTPELVRASSDYADRHGVPLMVDVRDLWPDVIADRLEKKFGFAPKWLLYPYERDVKHSLSHADSVTAITQGCLEWAQLKGNRTDAQADHDRVFRLASRPISRNQTRWQEIETAWKNRGFDPNSGKTIFAWAGSLTNQQATRALVQAQTLLSKEVRDRIQVVICGRGDLQNQILSVKQACEHLIYAGFVPRDEVQFLYDNSHYGLLCYDNTPDFQASFPNKFGEYLMSGLSVVTTINGVMQEEYGDQGFLETVVPTPEAITEALTLLADRKPDESIRVRARAVFQKDFDADIVYEAFCDHIEERVRAGSAAVEKKDTLLG